MPKSECITCGNEYIWTWDEAFYKFGFNDGDGWVETWQVEEVLSEAGYSCTVKEWGMHNTVINSIKKDGCELIPYDDPTVNFGYDDPRVYLPEAIIKLLDEKLPPM